MAISKVMHASGVLHNASGVLHNASGVLHNASEFSVLLPERSGVLSGFHVVVPERQDVFPSVQVTLPQCPKFELCALEGNLKKGVSGRNLATRRKHRSMWCFTRL